MREPAGLEPTALEAPFSLAGRVRSISQLAPARTSLLATHALPVRLRLDALERVRGLLQRRSPIC